MTTLKSTEPAAVAISYIKALAARDWDRAGAMWKPDAIDNLVGIAELRAPGEVVEFFSGYAAAVPDFQAEIISVTAQDDRAAVHWRMWGTFNGTGKLMGLTPNGRKFNVLGTDLFTVRDGLIVSNIAISNGMDLARQLAIMPPAGSIAERAAFGLVNSLAPLARAIRGRN